VYVASTNRNIAALDSRLGTLLWKKKLGGAIYSSPAVDASGIIYIGCDDAYVYSLQPSNGAVRWKFKTKGKIGTSSPAIGADGNIYIGSSDGNVYSIGTGNFTTNVCPSSKVIAPYSSVVFSARCSSVCPAGLGTMVNSLIIRYKDYIQ
jgi:outer membrane protein assembly factor BamB